MTETLPLEVDQIAQNLPHGDRLHQVQVTIAAPAWRHILGEFARQVFRAKVAKRPIFAWLLDAGRLDNRGPSRVEAISRLRTLVGQEQAFWLLSPEEATALGQSLLEAAESPEECWCGNVIEKPSSLTALTGCAACHGKGDD